MQYVEFVPLKDTGLQSEEPNDFICKLTIRGNLGIDTVPELSLLVKTLTTGGMRYFILNFENLNYIDSTGIGTLIRLKKSILSLSGDIVLYNVPPKVNEVFELVNLKEFIKLFYSEQKACEHLGAVKALKS